jgi:hypothetical protein
VPASRRDRSAVEHEAGHVEARERHRRARNRLVAADEDDDGVEVVRPRDQLDRVGDDLAADERHAHALGAHGDAVGHRDGVELHRRGAGFADAVLDRRRQPPQVVVARADFDPGVGDPDERFPEVFVGKSHRFEHGAGGRAVGAARDREAPAGTRLGRVGPGHA